jgi:plastocyanin
MRRVALLAGVGYVVLACGTGTGAQGGDLEVVLSEFHIEPASQLVKAGTIDLELLNDGQIPHTLVVASNDGTVLAASDAVQPEARETLTIRLEPGTYQLTCRIVFRGDDGLLVDHYQEGMGTVLTVEP